MGSICRYNMLQRAFDYVEKNLNDKMDFMIGAELIDQYGFENEYHIKCSVVLKDRKGETYDLTTHFAWGSEDYNEEEIEEYAIHYKIGSTVESIDYGFEREDGIYVYLNMSDESQIHIPLFYLEEDDENGIVDSLLSNLIELPVINIQ